MVAPAYTCLPLNISRKCSQTCPLSCLFTSCKALAILVWSDTMIGGIFIVAKGILVSIFFAIWPCSWIYMTNTAVLRRQGLFGFARPRAGFRLISNRNWPLRYHHVLSKNSVYMCISSSWPLLPQVLISFRHDGRDKPPRRCDTCICAYQHLLCRPIGPFPVSDPHDHRSLLIIISTVMDLGSRDIYPRPRSDTLSTWCKHLWCDLHSL